MKPEELQVGDTHVSLVRRLGGERDEWVVWGDDHAERGRLEQDSQGYRWRFNDAVGPWVTSREEAIRQLLLLR
jgi:hypothetical protein